MRRQVGQVADPPTGDAGGIEPGHDRLPVECLKDFGDLGFQKVPMRQPLLIVVEPVIPGDLLITQQIPAEGKPLPLVLDGEQKLFAITAGKGAIGRDGRMLQPLILRGKAAVSVLQVRDIHPVCGGMEQRDVNQPTLPLTVPFPGKQGEQNFLVGRHTR